MGLSIIHFIIQAYSYLQILIMNIFVVLDRSSHVQFLSSSIFFQCVFVHVCARCRREKGRCVYTTQKENGQTFDCAATSHETKVLNTCDVCWICCRCGCFSGSCPFLIVYCRLGKGTGVRWRTLYDQMIPTHNTDGVTLFPERPPEEPQRPF